MLKRATTLLIMLVVPLMATDALAQTDYTVREINAIPQDQIDALMAAGTALTAADINPASCAGLIYDNTHCGETVRFTAVVMSDPLNSGLANVNGDTGLPNRIHVFVRDVTADTEGNEGHGIQIVDGGNLGLESLIIGDVIEVVGEVRPFFGTMQINPESFTVVGSRDPATDPIFDPIIVTSADLNQDMGPDGAIQVNWANLPNIRGNKVQIVDATVLTRTVGDRPDYNVTTDGGATSVSGYDTSLRYRNDKDGVYPATFNVLDDDFSPPPSGARVNITGFPTMPGLTGSDPFSLGVPNGQVLAISPMEDSDLVVTESPPAITNMTRPATVPGLGGSSAITADIAADPTRSIASASLVYFTSSDATEIAVASSSVDGTVYTFEIPAALDGDFITYWVTATDNTGAVTTSSSLPLRSLVGGITSISHIQQTATGGPGSSPFFNMDVDMNLFATVQYTQAETNLVYLQDDPAGGPWSGVLVRNQSETGVLLAGDVINVTHALVQESFGLTRIRNITFTVVSTGGSPIAPRVMTTNVLQDPAIAESFEGVRLEINDPVITATNSDDPSGPFGEFDISSDGSSENAFRVDDGSSDVSYTGRDPGTVFSSGERLDFVRGTLAFSFGNYKLIPGHFSDIGSVINVATDESSVPASFTLNQNYPNPFNPSTQITFDIASTGHVALEVFDVLGRKVATLLNSTVAVGTHAVTFDAQNLSSGIYVYRLSSGSSLQTKKMLLMK